MTKTGGKIVNPAYLVIVDTDSFEKTGEVKAQDIFGNWHTFTGLDAIEFVMLVKPSAWEGRRLKWRKNVWIVHNLIGHPLMQILALIGLHKLAFFVHDSTVPKPKPT